MPFFLWDWAPQIGVPRERMADWQTRDLQAEVSEALDMPVYLQNDATSVSSAELLFGSEVLPGNALTIYIAFFVGGGLTLRNALYTGSNDNAAGLGPLMVTDRQGRATPLIDIASLCVLERRLDAAGIPAAAMWENPAEWPFPQEIVEAWCDDCAHGLAQAIHAVQTILDLKLVQIEGWLPRPVLQRITDGVKGAFDRFDASGIVPPRITPGTIGPDARAIGAASLPLSKRFLEETFSNEDTAGAA